MKQETGFSRMTRRWVMGALLAGVALPALARAPAISLLPRPRPDRNLATAVPRKGQVQSARSLIDLAGLGGAVGFVVADAKTGLVLEEANGTLGLPPASVAKTMTALYALDALGPDFRFVTRLMATGPVQNGQIAGDLILAGSGDPTLSTDILADMAKALKARGITRVAGKFLVWGDGVPLIERIDPAQPEQVAYNPAISGLNLNFNRVYFEWRKVGASYSITMDARSDLYRPRVRTATMRVAARDAPLYTYAAEGGGDHWTVAGPALGNSGSRWLPVRCPELYTGQTFQSLAAALGIVVPDPVVSRQRPVGAVLVAQQSAALSVILRDMLRYSTNMTAEIIGLTASRARGGNPGDLKASAAQMSRWLAQTFGLKTASFVDHSGLGGATRIAPADLVRALVAAGPASQLRSLLRSYAPKADEGAQAQGVTVSAKTGTLNFVSGLAGYATPKGGPDLVFAIFCADAARRDIVPMAQRELPEGGRAWTKRARKLQQALLERWATVYGA